MDVPSTVSGVIKEVLVQLGSKVSEGAILIKVESGAVATAPAAQVAALTPTVAVAAPVCACSVQRSSLPHCTCPGLPTGEGSRFAIRPRLCSGTRC